MDTQGYYMWDYWRDKYGLTSALKDYYPNTLQHNERLRLAVAAIENAESAIESIMEELADIEDSPNR